ncbi:MAG: hypothetical protein VKJ64_02330 [Leptolyngbyaceae bacterium]|nr:hypothetical protein [Leptolyngbyaceae bacterium]
MRFWLQILLITGITVGLSGCDTISGFLPGGGGDDGTTTEGTPVPVNPEATDPNAADPNAADPNVTEEGATDEGLAFEEPVIVGSTSGDLIQSTSPEERIQGVERDRPDPFDILPTTPTIEIPDDVVLIPENTNEEPDVEIIPPTEEVPLPELAPIAPPPPPEPVTARAVAVTGVVQIGSVPYAIVNAPNEPHSRYVRSGQLLSNGQVLVKRIELFPGVADPVVILEEFGIEVSREVGDVPATPDAAPDVAPDAAPDAVPDADQVEV